MYYKIFLFTESTLFNLIQHIKGTVTTKLFPQTMLKKDKRNHYIILQVTLILFSFQVPSVIISKDLARPALVLQLLM